MKITKEHAIARVDATEARRHRYFDYARDWTRMMKHDAKFGTTVEAAIREQNREQVITPKPQSTVNLAMRLVSAEPDVRVAPKITMDERSLQDAKLVQKWLTNMWQYLSEKNNCNVITDNFFWVYSMGKAVFDVRWIKDELPDSLKDEVFPISIRALNPLTCGIHQGPLYPEYCYHKYMAPILDIIQAYRGRQVTKKSDILQRYINEARENDGFGEDTEGEIIDFWYRSKDDGLVWNMVLLDNETLIDAHETNYYDFPLVFASGDPMIELGDDADGLPIIFPLMEIWEYECRLTSQVATGIMYDYWPFIAIINDDGTNLGDITVEPGVTRVLPPNTRIEKFALGPNIQIAQQMLAQIDGQMQLATFPGVMYGQAPGELQAGYGVSLLSDAAKGRTKNFKESMERAVAKVNSLVLSMIERNSGDEGVTVQGMGPTDRIPYYMTLVGEQIAGNYANRVFLSPEVMQDTIQEITAGNQLFQSHVITAETFRDQFVPKKLPEDEGERTMLEEALMSDELRMWRIQSAVMKYFDEPGDDGLPMWSKVLKFTPDLLPTPPDGMQWTKDGTLEQAPPPQPAQPPMGGPPPQGPPPQGGPMGPGGPPPGGPPPGGPAPGSGGVGAPAQLIPPQGGGIPPNVQPQLTPEQLDMIRQQDPILFQMVQNGEISQAQLWEMLNAS